MLFLVRQGRALIDPGLPEAEWELDPTHFDDVWALRESGRLPRRARWFCSPGPRSIATAQLLTEGDVGVLDVLRGTGGEAAIGFMERVVGSVTALIAEDPATDVVLIGHAPVWTSLEAALTGREPDPDRWASLGTPDVIEVDAPVASS